MPDEALMDPVPGVSTVSGVSTVVPGGEQQSPPPGAVDADNTILTIDGGTPGPTGAAQAPASDFPPPPALASTAEFDWTDDLPLVDMAAALGRALAMGDDLYRAASYAGGLIVGSTNANVPPQEIRDARLLTAVILDRLRVRYFKKGELAGYMIPSRHLQAALQSEAFLQAFRVVDEVIRSPRFFGAEFTLTAPGYQDGGQGQRCLYAGLPATIAANTETIKTFIDAMPFETRADGTNAVGAALVRMLRNYWPGGKPLVPISSSKSHSGKGTIVDFIAGTERQISISYQANADWPLERSFVGALKAHPDVGLINIDNARAGRGARVIASSFIERVATDPKLFLFSTGSGRPVQRTNDVVLTLTTNEGAFSIDILNRGWPIHLVRIGDLTELPSRIGNPRLEYLRANRARIEAELRGMMACWKAAGCPLDNSVRHPFIECTRVIGGILLANGFQDFLGNYSSRRTIHDPVRNALGMLGATRPNEWLRPNEWVQLVVTLGLEATILPNARGNQQAQERDLGIIFSTHRDETFVAETDDARVELQLEKKRARRNGLAVTLYRFNLLGSTELPCDEEANAPA